MVRPILSDSLTHLTGSDNLRHFTSTQDTTIGSAAAWFLTRIADPKPFALVEAILGRCLFGRFDHPSVQTSSNKFSKNAIINTF